MKRLGLAIAAWLLGVAACLAQVPPNAAGTLMVPNGGGGGGAVNSGTATNCSTTQVLFALAGAVSCDTGFTYAGSGGAVSLTGTLNLPDTAAGPVGIINFGGARYVHDTGGISNTFVGHNAGNLTVTGTNNTALGESAGLVLAGGNGNTAVGRNTLGAVIGGSNNTGLGSQTGSAVTGSSNTLVGAGVLPNAAAVAQNTIVGQGSGAGITSGGNNTIIGQGVTGLAAGTANTVILAIGGGTIEADFALTTAATWTFNGALAASLNAATGTNAVCNTPGAKTPLTVQVWATGCAASSIRFKEGIASIDPAKALDDVLRFQPISYFYKPEFNMGADKHVGFTAEQVGSVDPQWVTYEDDGVTPHAVKYNEMAPLLAAAIQQLKADNDNLRAEIEELKRRVH